VVAALVEDFRTGPFYDSVLNAFPSVNHETPLMLDGNDRL